MKKKFFAVAMATTMVMSTAVTAMAEDVDCTGFWAAHSKSYEVDADGLNLTFKTQTYELDEDKKIENWFTPIYVVYTADKAFAGGAGINDTEGYTEAFVMRSDNYGWIGTLNTAGADALTAAGFTIGESKGVPASNEEWATWLAGCQEGTTGELKATKGDGTVTVAFTVNGLTSNMTIPVDTSKPVYISLSGELCKVTDIAEGTAASGDTTPATDNKDDAADKNDGATATDKKDDSTTTTKKDDKKDSPKTGDVAPVAALASLAVVACAGVVVSRKKVTE